MEDQEINILYYDQQWFFTLMSVSWRAAQQPPLIRDTKLAKEAISNQLMVAITKREALYIL